MFVAAARCELHLPMSGSLKAKRAVLNRLKDRIRQHSAAAVAEVGHNDLWQRAALGLVVVSGEAGHADELLASARRIVESEAAVVVLDWTSERY